MSPPTRRIACAVAIAASVATLSGCGVPRGAHLGLSVSDAGAPVAVIVMCNSGGDEGVAPLLPGLPATLPDPGPRVDGLSIIESGSTTDVVTVTLTEPIESTTTVELGATSAAAKIAGRMDDLTAGTEYELAGWTVDNEWSTYAVRFVPEDLATIEPREVLWQQIDDSRQRTRTGSLDDFESAACR